MYYEVYNGNNPFKPSPGERDVNCAVFQDLSFNKLSCQVFDDYARRTVDTWDASFASLSSITTASIEDSVANTQNVGPMTTAQYDVYSYKVSGYFFAGYKPENQNKRYRQCVRPWQIGGYDFSKCQYFDLPHIETACTNNGIMAASSEVSLGLAALFGSLSFF